MADPNLSLRKLSLWLNLLLIIAVGLCATGIAFWAGIVPANLGVSLPENLTENTPMKTDSLHPLDGKWVITKASDVDMRDDHEMYLEITDSAVYGEGPCNDFTTRVLISGNDLGFMPIEIGRESCASGPMRHEQDFIQNLMRVSRYEIQADELVLYMVDVEALRARKVR